MEKKSKKKINWQSFVISVLGTSIGVALTLIASGMMEHRSKQQAQRLTAIMVIHDIDNTIEYLRSWKEQAEQEQKLFQYVQEHKDQKDPLPSDTLEVLVDRLVKTDSGYHFDTSKEQIFNSDVDIWQNLGNMKFIDNVQEVFNERRSLIEATNSTEWFGKPIPAGDYMQVVMGGWDTQEEYDALRWSFLKKQFRENRVGYYMDVSSYRASELGRLIERFTLLNDENKFIMGITDRELEDYVNSISNKGIALTRGNLPGRWLFETKDQRIEYDFHSGQGIDITNVLSSGFTSTRYWSGFLKIQLLYRGKWAIQGDSLIIARDGSEVDIQVDTSGISVQENMQDSLTSWINSYQDQLRDYFQTDSTEKTERTAWKVRLDSSRDKMEWSGPESKVRYLKRVKE